MRQGTAIATALAVLAGALTAANPHTSWTPKAYPPHPLDLHLPLRLFLLGSSPVFVFQAYVNESLLYRDPGFGHTWQTPLPNGYAILMLDEHHDGTVFNPATHFSDSSNNDIHPDGPDAVSGVRVIQLAGNKILGGAGPIGQYSSPAARNRIDSYFLLDTDAHTRANFPNYDALTQAAQPLGIAPHLEPIYRVYKRYRFTWFDLQCNRARTGSDSRCGFLISRRIWRLRQPAPQISAPPELRSAS